MAAHRLLRLLGALLLPLSLSAAGSSSAVRASPPTASSSSPPPPAPPAPQTCRLFVWDAVSAARYHICIRLLRTNIYEGRGGRRFVRIRPGSVLEYLYPCSDHAPDRCAVCGGSFDDHLDRWWRTRVGTPYDAALNEARDNGGVTFVRDDILVGRKRKGNTGSGSSVPFPPRKVLAFHRRYVEEIDAESQQQQQQQQQQGNQGRSQKSSSSSRNGGSSKRSSPTRENTAAGSPSFEQRSDSSVPYRVPSFRRNTKLGAWAANLAYLARVIVLDEMDTLLWMQSRENARLDWEANQY